jgi:hypothetical protein
MEPIPSSLTSPSDMAEKTFTFRFAPIAVIPRRRIALQKKWFDYLAEAMNPAGISS